MQSMRFQREYPANGEAVVTRFEIRSAPSDAGSLSGEMFTEDGRKIATFTPAGPSVVQFTIEHRATGEGRHVWRVVLGLYYLGTEEPEAKEDSISADVASAANAASAAPVIVRLAAEFWTHWHKTGTALDRALLHRVLGVWAPLDAAVAASFLLEAEQHADAIAKQAVDSLASDPMSRRDGARERLASELRKRLPEIRESLVPDGSVKATPEENGVLLWDARLARWLEGEKQKAIARALLKMSAGNAAPWTLWLPTPNGEPPTKRLAFAAVALWKNGVRDAVEREARSGPLSVNANVHDDGAVYARIPKIASPLAWAMGAQGKPLECTPDESDEPDDAPDNAPTDQTTEVDGQRFARVPSVGARALVPRSWSLLPNDRDKYPHQVCLPLSVEEDALPVVVSQNQGVVMSTIAGKLALLTFASPEVQAGNMTRITLGELTRQVYPGLASNNERQPPPCALSTN